MNKGVVFSIDALLGAILLSLFAASIAFLAARSAEDTMGNLLLKRQAADLLTAMDKSGVLESMDAASANSTLQSALTPEESYSLEADYYNYTDGNFTWRNESYVDTDGNRSNAKGTVESDREFVVAQAGQQPVFGVARLALWTE
jgi:hypothetical protein